MRKSRLFVSLLALSSTAQGFESPSKIQAQAIPEMLKGGNVVVAAETGSGKTLAYLLPLVQQLKQAEVRSVLATKHRASGVMRQR